MIDFEAEIFTELKKQLKIDGSTIEQDTPPTLPYFAFEMLDNPVYMRTYDGDGEKFTAPKFCLTVYADAGDKETAKTYLTMADNFLSSIGVIRTAGPQKVKSKNNNICEMMNIYNNNLIDANGNIYRK